MAYDIFISYRRTDNSGLTSGTNIARTIKQQLEIQGYKNRVFFDYSELSDDEFERIILAAIEQCRVFVLVLSKDAMMRCVNDGDWVRREIVHAQKHGLKIIPVEPDDLFNGYPIRFPAELDVVKRVQHSKIHMDSSFERDIRAMIDTRIRPAIPDINWPKIFRNALFVVLAAAIAAWLFLGGGMEMLSNISTPNPQKQEQSQKVKPTSKSVTTNTTNKQSVSKPTPKETTTASAPKPVETPQKVENPKPADNPAPRQNPNQDLIDQMVSQGKGRNGVYQLGDYYNNNGKEGVVFEVSADGRNGKIVSLDQKNLPWCTGKYTIADASSKSNGKSNSDNILSGNDSENYPAIAWCCSKGQGWYLPAINELTTLLLNGTILNAVNRTLQNRGTMLFEKGDKKWYWSSTEYPSNAKMCAYRVYMGYAESCDGIKQNENYVRAVARF